MSLTNGSVGQFSILLIEDNPEYAHVLTEIFDLAAPRKFAPTVEPSLASGLMSLDHDRPDVVLLDLGLPDSHGLPTLISVAEKAEGIPIIVLTAVDEGAMAFRCLEEGAFAYMVKSEVDPLSFSEVVARAASTNRGLSSPTEAQPSDSAPAQQDGPRLYAGEVAIHVRSPAGVSQTVRFLTQINREAGVKVVLQSGSQQDTRLVVKLMAPTPLKERLAQMEGVESVNDGGQTEEEAKLVVALG